MDCYEQGTCTILRSSKNSLAEDFEPDLLDAEQPHTKPGTAPRTAGLQSDLPAGIVEWPPAEWSNASSSEASYYCQHAELLPASIAGQTGNQQVIFYFRVGSLRQLASAQVGRDDKTYAHTQLAIAFAALVQQLGPQLLPTIESDNLLAALADPNVMAHHYLRIPIWVRHGAMRFPSPGDYDLAVTADEFSTALRLLLAAPDGDALNLSLPSYQSTTHSAIELELPPLGAFADWGDRAGYANDWPKIDYCRDAATLYRVLHFSAPVTGDAPPNHNDVNINLTIICDILSKSAFHVQALQQAYDAGAAQDHGDKRDLVSQLVDYSENIRIHPEQGSVRNFLLYLLAAGGADTPNYNVSIHKSASPFRLQVLDPIRDGERVLVNQMATSWFYLELEHPGSDPNHPVSSLLNLEDDQYFTVSWFVSRPREPRRIVLGKASARKADALPRLAELRQNPSDSHGVIRSRNNPRFWTHDFDERDIGDCTIICSIAWRLRPRAGQPPLPPEQASQVHFVELPVTVTPNDSYLDQALRQVDPKPAAQVVSSYYARAMQTVAMPWNERIRLLDNVLDTEHEDFTGLEVYGLGQHNIISTGAALPHADQDHPYVAPLKLASATPDITGDWFVATTSDSYTAKAVTVGASVDPKNRIRGHVKLAVAAHRTSEFVFLTYVPGDYVVLCLPADGSAPLAFSVRVVPYHCSAAEGALAYHNKARRIEDALLYEIIPLGSTPRTPPPQVDGITGATLPSTDVAELEAPQQTRLVPIRGVLQKDDGGLVEITAFLGNISRGLEGSADQGYADGVGWKLYDATVGQNRTAYHGGTIDRCFSMFASENTHPSGWIKFEWVPPNDNDTSPSRRRYTWGPYRTHGTNSSGRLAANLGWTSLGTGLAGMGLAFLSSGPIGWLAMGCLLLSNITAIGSVLASMHNNVSQDEIDSTLIWVDIAGLVACLAGLRNMAALRELVVAQKAGAPIARQQRLAINLKQVAQTEVVLSGAEVITIGITSFEQIGQVLDNVTDPEERAMRIGAIFATMLLAGGFWCIGAKDDVIPAKQDPHPVPEPRLAAPTLEGPQPRIPPGLESFLSDEQAALLRDLARRDPEAARQFYRDFHEAEERDLVDEADLQSRLARAFAPPPELDIDTALDQLMANLTNPRDRRDLVEIVAQLSHREHVSGLENASGRRLLADLLTQLETSGPSGVSVHIAAQAIATLGPDGTRYERLLAPALLSLDNIGTDRRALQIAHDHYGNAIRLLDEIAPFGNINRSALRRIFDDRHQRIVQQRIVPAIADWGVLTEDTRVAFRKVTEHHTTPSGKLDQFWLGQVSTLYGDVQASLSHFVSAQILLAYARCFGFERRYALRLLTYATNYAESLRPALQQCGLSVRDLRQFDALHAAAPTRQPGRRTDDSVPPSSTTQPPAAVAGRSSRAQEPLERLEADIERLSRSSEEKAHLLRWIRRGAQQGTQGTAFLFGYDEALLARMADTDDATKRAIFALARWSARPQFRPLMLELLDHNYRRWFGSADDFDGYLHAVSARTAAGGPALGATARQLPPPTSMDYPEWLDYLISTGFSQVSAQPQHTRFAADAIWQHRYDGSAVRLSYRIFQDGSTALFVSAAVVGVDGDGHIITAALPADGQGTAFEGQVATVVFSPNTDGNLLAPPTQAAIEDNLRNVLRDELELEDGDASRYAIQPLLDLFTTRAQPEVSSQPGQRRQPQPSANDQGDVEPSIENEVSVDIDDTLGVENPLGLPRQESEQLVADWVAARSQRGVATNDRDRDALRALSTRVDGDGLQLLEPVVVETVNVHVLFADDTTQEIRTQMIEIIIARSMSRIPVETPTDLEDLYRLLRAIDGELDRYEFGLAYCHSLRDVAALITDSPQKARALLRLAHVRGLLSAQYADAMGSADSWVTDTEFYGTVFDAIGADAFRINTEHGELLLLEPSPAVRTSIANFRNDRQVSPADSRQAISGYSTDGSPYAQGSAQYDAWQSQLACADALATRGLSVEILPWQTYLPDEPPRSLPRPDLDRLDTATAEREQRRHAQDDARLVTQRHAYDELRLAIENRNRALEDHGVRPYVDAVGDDWRMRPSLLVDGIPFTVVEVTSGQSAEEVIESIRLATRTAQSRNFVIQSSDNAIDPNQMATRISEQPPLFLEEVLLIDPQRVTRIYPNDNGEPVRVLTPVGPSSQTSAPTTVVLDDPELTELLNPELVESFNRLAEAQPEAAQRILNQLGDSAQSLRAHGDDIDAAKPRLQKWFADELETPDAVDLDATRTALLAVYDREQLEIEDLQAFDQLIDYYRAQSDISGTPDGLLQRRLAGLANLAATGQDEACVRRLRALAYWELGQTNARAESLMGPTIAAIDDGDFGTAESLRTAVLDEFPVVSPHDPRLRPLWALYDDAWLQNLYHRLDAILDDTEVSAPAKQALRELRDQITENNRVREGQFTQLIDELYLSWQNDSPRHFHISIYITRLGVVGFSPVYANHLFEHFEDVFPDNRAYFRLRALLSLHGGNKDLPRYDALYEQRFGEAYIPSSSQADGPESDPNYSLIRDQLAPTEGDGSSLDEILAYRNAHFGEDSQADQRALRSLAQNMDAIRFAEHRDAWRVAQNIYVVSVYYTSRRPGPARAAELLSMARGAANSNLHVDFESLDNAWTVIRPAFYSQDDPLTKMRALHEAEGIGTFDDIALFCDIVQNDIALAEELHKLAQIHAVTPNADGKSGVVTEVELFARALGTLRHGRTGQPIDFETAHAALDELRDTTGLAISLDQYDAGRQAAQGSHPADISGQTTNPHPPQTERYGVWQGQQQAVQVLADHGFAVQRFPDKAPATEKMLTAHGLRINGSEAEGSPRTAIGGVPFTLFKLTSGTLDTLPRNIAVAAANGHTRNLVIHSDGASYSPEKIQQVFAASPPPLLEECLVVWRDQVFRVYPGELTLIQRPGD